MKTGNITPFSDDIWWMWFHEIDSGFSIAGLWDTLYAATAFQRSPQHELQEKVPDMSSLDAYFQEFLDVAQ